MTTLSSVNPSSIKLELELGLSYDNRNVASNLLIVTMGKLIVRLCIRVFVNLILYIRYWSFELCAHKTDPILLVHPTGIPVLSDQQLVHVVWILIRDVAEQAEEGHGQTDKQNGCNADNAGESFELLPLTEVNTVDRAELGHL